VYWPGAQALAINSSFLLWRSPDAEPYAPSRSFAPLLLRRRPKSTPAQEKKLPRFEDYPVEEKWNGIAAPVKLQSRADRMFRANFRNAAREKPNFAGDYSVATWGCGTQCVEGGIVDLTTGELSCITISKPAQKAS
jgi:hypothetical protein